MSDFEHRGFTASIEFSMDDELLVGKISNIDALIMFSAENVKDLKSEFRAAVEEYISHCNEAGVEPCKPYKGTFNVRVGSELHRAVANVARRKGIALNDAIKQASIDYVERANAEPHRAMVEQLVNDITQLRSVPTVTFNQRLDIPDPYIPLASVKISKSGSSEVVSNMHSPYSRTH